MHVSTGPLCPEVAAVLLAGLLGAHATGQTPPQSPPGFAATAVAVESLRAAQVRAFTAVAGDAWLLAVGNRLEHFAAGRPPRLVARLRASEDVAFLAPSTSPGSVFCGELNHGTIRRFSTSSWLAVASFPGPANAFDAEVLPSGDVLLVANPLWPAPGAHSGVWLAGPGRTPREILALQGPSGPLLLDHQGDLIVAELGPSVPPPPGAARLLRIPAAKLQLAIAGATLTTSDATATGSGFAGLYDLAEDDLGRLHVTDPASGLVTTCDPGSLTPSRTTLDVGQGFTALGLHFENGTGAPFLAYQPTPVAPSLLVTRTDFWSRFEVLRLSPERPRLDVGPSPLPAWSTATATIQDAPAAGLAVLLANTGGHGPESIVATLNGAPLWLAFAPTAQLALLLLPLDAQGHASTTFTNPGGFTATVDFQAVVFSTSAVPDFGSTSLRSIQLLP